MSILARIASAMALAALVCVPAAHAAGAAKTLFTEQESVREFDLVTGRGTQVGTVLGLVSGTSSVEFQLVVAGPPAGDALPITFHNRVIITDVDGDQIFFDADGTGTFHLGVPGASFSGAGGPLKGTLVVTAATGKFSTWQVGSAFGYRAVMTNPADQGTVYGEATYTGSAPK